MIKDTNSSNSKEVVESGSSIKKLKKIIKVLSIIAFLLAVFWIVFSNISYSRVPINYTNNDVLEWLSNPDVFYILDFTTMTILTGLVIILFSILYLYIKSKNRYIALAGMILVPIYGTMNLICYSIQITIVPSIVRHIMSTSGDITMAYQFIISDGYTFAGFVNSLATAIFGITTILYGYILIKERKWLSSILFIAHGVLCLIGIVGYVTESSVLMGLSMVGGFAFILSLLFLAIDFRERK